MRISDWSSDVCSSDLAFTSALNGASSCSERKRLDHSSSALERRTLQPGSSKMPWVSQSVKGLNGAGGGASMLRPSPPAAATEDVPLRSEERRVGNESVSTFRYGCSPYIYKTTTIV